MNKENIDLGKGKIGKLLLTLAVPTIIGQLVNLLYNIIDRIFIGKMASGDLAMAGVGVAMPIILLVSAFAMLIGSGGAPLTAIEMGRQNNDKAEEIMSKEEDLLETQTIVKEYLKARKNPPRELILKIINKIEIHQDKTVDLHFKLKQLEEVV